MGDVWGQQIPSWISAVASALAVIAVYLAWRSLRADEQRDRSRDAQQIGAWWSIGKLPPPENGAPVEKNPWGVTISNPTPTVIRNITVDVRGAHGAEDGCDLRLQVLPPGRHFFVRASRARNALWGIRTLPPGTVFEAVPHSRDVSIARIAFTDATGQRWSWTPEDGLADATDSVAAGSARADVG